MKTEIYIILFLLILLLFQIYLSVRQVRNIHRNYKENNRQMNDAMMKNQRLTDKWQKEIEQQKLLLAQKEDNIKKQINVLKTKIQNYEDLKGKVTQSILYAKNIQNAILPPVSYINSILKESFILYRPKDIVSGDYYWIAQKSNKIIVAVADCTGHGVPGALMSMLGIAFLNEIVGMEMKTNKFQLYPNQILDLLSEKIMKSLHQTGQTGETRDGMDIALCIIDKDKQLLQYAGAFSPIYILKDKGLKAQKSKNVDFDDIAIKRKANMKIEQGENFELVQLIADKRPIGIHYEDKGFRNFEIDVKHNDAIYMFSDGYSDQFGGSKGRKFSSRRFKHLIIKNFAKPMAIQKEILDTTIDNWRGDQEQVDDILVMGIRLLFDNVGTKTKHKIDWSNKVFLVAEDDDVHFRYIKEILASTKAKLIWAKNGKEALMIYHTMKRFDLAIVDIHMPVMDGFELIKKLKELEPSMPVIVQAAYKMSNEKERSIDAGCDDYLPKPINPNEFLNSIKKFIST